MIAAIAMAIIAAVIMGTILMLDIRSRSEVGAARRADRNGRRARNLMQAINVIPRGYLPKGGLVQLFNEVSRCAEVMIKSNQSVFVRQGKDIQDTVEEKLKELKDAGVTGSSPLNITTKSQVEVIREGAKYLHEYVVRLAQEDRNHHEKAGRLLLMLDFSCTRAVADYYSSSAKSHIKAGDKYKARLALERAAEVLGAWVGQVDWAERAIRDFKKRAEELAGATQKVSGNSDKEWQNWETASDWKKKVQYD